VEETKNWWKCSDCGYTFETKAPPGLCPCCGETCAFPKAKCYTPECGGPGNMGTKVGRR
jgi:rubredoxin